MELIATRIAQIGEIPGLDGRISANRNNPIVKATDGVYIYFTLRRVSDVLGTVSTERDVERKVWVNQPIQIDIRGAQTFKIEAIPDLI